ncbi:MULTISPECIES: LysR family transcriptional regulator [unclassified Sphingomonas]|uniref:LysR family transcriptional regulator n=1 Tax=unclassified Sphingomonas TaxID=196159 RepID=UPI0006F21EE6|nr:MULTISPECIES: LysR family transcriptional regulator [unclassified Sphingomonas]KRB78773.1 LysR family transcriptional regulator [Sphingomonas sp. Root710]KRB93682.1 LysR family transcriptional regulator [Sphingomonas sp. Root720]
MPAPFDLNLHHLRALGAIVRRGGMSAAADAIGMSQPALTQGLAKLEAQLGVSLFERRPDGMKATSAGLLLVDRVEAAFEYLSAAKRSGTRGFGRPEWLMTATQLRAFLALADAGSFVTAAQATALSQPALHRSVRDLEQVIGVSLVERRGRGVTLSGAGRRLARGIRLAASEIAAAIAETRPPGEGSGNIVIGAMPLSRASLVPRAVAGLIAERPDVTLSIVEGSWRELIEPLREGVIDLMIGALRPVVPPDLRQRPLIEDRPVVVAGAQHPLAGAAEVSRATLAAFPWAVAPPGSPLRAHWEELFAGRTPPPRPIECGSVMVLRGLLTRGDFLTLLSPEQVALEVANGILAFVGAPLAQCVRTIGVTNRADWRPTAAQRRFLEHLDETEI